MGDRPLRIQDDFETMQRLLNELKYETKQYEQEIEKETQLTSELDCKTEAAKQEVKLNKEAVKQQDEEEKLLSQQCVQNMQSYSSLQEACDISSEQEKGLSRNLKELKNSDETVRAKRKTTTDRYEAIYNSYKEKYEKHPLAVQLKQKAEELANWEANYNEAKLMAQETAKKLMLFEKTAATSVNEFPVFKNQNEFIIRLAGMKVAFDKLSSELDRKTYHFEELKKVAGEKVKAKRQMEEEKKKDELKRIAEERVSGDKRMKAEVQRQEERRLHSEEQRRMMEERQLEGTSLRWHNQNIAALQCSFQRDGFRSETTIASQTTALQAASSFQQRLPPKIFLPSRHMPFQQKQDIELGVFRVPLPPKEVRNPVTGTGKRLQSGETSFIVRSPVPHPPITAGPVPRQRPIPDVLDATALPVPPRQPLYVEFPVAMTPTEQPSCPESSTVPPKQGTRPGAFHGISSCLQNLSIAGQTDETLLMETEDEETLPTGFNSSSFPHTDSNSVAHSGFNQHNEGGAAEDQENLMLTRAPIQEQEANQEKQRENCLDTETPMSTDEAEEQPPSVETAASDAGFVYPEISLNVSNTKSNAIESYYNSALLDEPVSHSAMPNVTTPITTSICLPTDISPSPDLSCSLVSETAAITDCPTLTVTSRATYPETVEPSDLYCPTSEENASASKVSDSTTSVASDVVPAASTSMSCVESVEQPSGWTTCSTMTPIIPIGENAESGNFIASNSPVVEFNFEEEMAKLKKLSESPALNVYSGRRMFVHSDQSEVEGMSEPVHETGGTASFMSNFGQFEGAQQTKESDKATNPDFGFGNFFTLSNRSDSDDMFSFFGGRVNEAEKSAKSGKDVSTSSDDVFKLFGGNDAENATSRKKETSSEGPSDIFHMFGSNSNVSDNSTKNKSDGDGGFFNFGPKPANDGPAKSQFKFF